jgi:radical SAM protein with 4Fe4S-binding SPASM domain
MGQKNECRSLHAASPYHVVWLATNVCNLRCLHCSSDSGEALVDELRTDEVLTLLNDLAAWGVIDLAISGGEPLLRPDLFEIVEYAVQRGFSVGLGSNGTTLTNGNLERLRRLGLSRLQISLDGLSEAHERLRGEKGLFGLAVENIRKSLSHGLRTNVCFTVNRLNVDQLEHFFSFAATLGINRLNISRYVPTGRKVDHQLDLEPGEWRQAITRLKRLTCLYEGKLQIVTHLSQQILIDPELERVPGFSGCQAGRGQGCVTANGDVWPCVLLPIPLGNVRVRTIKELWKSSPVIQRLNNRDKLKGACGNCGLRNLCGGCRAVAFATGGDVLAPDPRCWLMPEC